jgi:4-amino-4-deoxy-L-arabinose transferase-like glycosyltransferase
MPTATVRRSGWAGLPALGLRLRALSHPVWPALAVGLFAGYMRLRGLAGSHPNPFYDAAIRSMGESWHNFLFGAYDPSGQLAVDKPPVDLWVQVASVKVLGFGARALVLPAAIFGTLAVPLLYDAVRRVFGRLAGVCAAVALAVLPVSVVSSRSDALDSMMMALAVLAVWLCVRAVQTGRARWFYLAALVMGIDFNVKLFEALIPLPAIFLLYLLAARVPLRRRVAQLGLGAAIFVASALSWVTAVSLSPGSHPYPIGSSDGSVWNVVFVFNGYDRLLAHTNASAPGLFGPGVGARIGPELVAAFVLGGLAALVGLRLRGARRLPRAELAAAAALGLWLVTGTVLFQRMHALRARYLEAFTPAVAAALGIGVALLALRAARGRRTAAIALAGGLVATPLLLRVLTPATAARPGTVAIVAGAAGVLLAPAAAVAMRAIPAWRRFSPVAAVALAGLALVSVLGASTSYSARLVRAHTTDSGHGKQLPARTLGALDRFLIAHRGGTRYEYGASDPSRAGGLIVRDGQPALLLETYHGHQVVTPARLRSLVASGQVRWFVTKRPCSPHFHGGCVPALRWVTSHGVNVTRRYGLPSAVRLYEVTPSHALAAPRS